MTEPPGTKGPAAAGAAGSGECARSEAQPSATPRKWQRILHSLVDGRTLNRFDAYRELRDSCLNNTISHLERSGLTILRKSETARGTIGQFPSVTYRLAIETRAHARELLGFQQELSA